MTQAYPAGAFRVCSLYSGSSGNATLIRTPDATLLIDAGKNARALTRALASIGVEPREIDAILITHEHRDHTSALPVFLKQNPCPVHITAPSARALKLEMTQELIDCLEVHPPLFTLEFGQTRVISFPTSHDSRMCIGYRITHRAPDLPEMSIGFATDMGTVDKAVREGLCGCRAVVLEANHDPEMLMGGRYPYQLKERIDSRYGHLSNPEAAVFCAELAHEGTRAFLLAHLSEENNLPDLACAEVRMALGDRTIPILAASADTVTEMDLTEVFSPCCI